MTWFDGILAEGFDTIALVGGLFAAVLGAVWLLRARMRARADDAAKPARVHRVATQGASKAGASGAHRAVGEAGPAHVLEGSAGNGSDGGNAVAALARRRGDSRTGPPAHTRVFEVLRRLGPGKDLGHVLQGIVDAVGEEFGFPRVVLRVYNPRTRLFEARAFHGCDEDLIHRISNLDVSLDEWAGMARRAARLGNSYLVPAADTLWTDRLGVNPEPEEDHWSPEPVPQTGLARLGRSEVLVVPMNGEEGDVLGYLAFAEAQPTDEPTVANLEILAFQAVLALETSRLRSRLKRRELEYSVVSEQLKDWQATRDNFVANVSHELRTPLTSIKAYAETLERSQAEMDDTTRREFVEVILREAERLNQVFDDLLDVAHMEGGRRRVVRDRVDLSATIEHACEGIAPRFAEKRVKLHSDLPADPLLVQGDAEGLLQVVTNLISNALKFTPADGAVIVSLREDTGTARVTVEDSGIGIPEHELSRIFERFYQVDGSSTRAYGGQGLGLSICRDIIGWHHGRIWAENRATGGAQFVFTLPVRGLVVRQSAQEVGIDGAERLQWEAFLRLSTTLVAEILGTRVASIMLVDEFEEVLRIEAAVGLDEEIVQNGVVSRGEGVAGTVWRHGQSVLVPDLDDDDRFQGLADNTTYRPRSLLSVPLWWEERVIGVLNVNSKANGRSFDEDDRLLLEAMAERIVLALESFERYRAGYRRLASVESGVRAMLEVGRERRTHLREMLVRCGVQTGRELGLDIDHLRSLAYALRTYDLGLAQVSTQILRKVSPLTREERARIEDHVQLGAELVGDMEPSPKVKKMILHHHENVDGSGYPEGLKGEAIPIGARVVRLVDALSALLHDRPFRPAMRLDEAIDLLQEGVGRRFCPRATPVFLSIVREHESLVHSLHPRARRDGGHPPTLPLEDLRIREH